jgi:hypothetical protein
MLVLSAGHFMDGYASIIDALAIWCATGLEIYRREHLPR